MRTAVGGSDFLNFQIYIATSSRCGFSAAAGAALYAVLKTTEVCVAAYLLVCCTYYVVLCGQREMPLVVPLMCTHEGPERVLCRK